MTDDKARLYVAHALAPGVELRLEGAQAHYLGRVMRAGPGDGVRLFNGSDGEWQARVEGSGRGWCALTVHEQTRRQAAGPDLWLLFAPLKKTPMDFIATKATELGVRRLCPVLTRLTAAVRVNTTRLQANTVEAAEQCGRLTVPEVAPPRRLGDVLADWPAGRRLLVMDESGAGTPVAQALAPTQATARAGESAAAPPPDAILVGPEGGFEAAELDALAILPFVTRIGLGPRLLHAETAAVAALAC